MTDPRLDSVLQAALNRLESAMNAAATHSGTVLGQLALNANNAAQRQLLMDAELLLQRDSTKLLRSFSKELQNRVEKEIQRPQQDSKGGFLSDTDWSSLSLVDDAEVERGVAADRLAQELAVECDKALEALNSYLSSALDNSNPDKNPLRPQVVAKAWLKALGDLSDDLQVINLIVQQVGRLLSKQLNQAYEQTTQELKSLGIQPQALSVQRSRPTSALGGGDHAPTRPAGLQDAEPTTQSGGWHQPTQPAPLGGYASPPQSQESLIRAAQALSDMFGVSVPSQSAGDPIPMGLRGRATPGHFAPVSPDFQHLLRQINLQTAATDWHATMPGGAIDIATGPASGFAAQLMAPNLIRVHREELVQASGGAALDKMVIDIVAALFDQVLSDPKVPPEAARQIARLQMPVLRVALGDMSFFNSRKHPVRRFVNRIASLAASFESLADGSGKQFLEHATQLVNDIVEGDFDKMDLYEAKLKELESFTDTETEREAAEHAAVSALLNNKEADLRVQQRYMQILRKELAQIEMPEFVRDFLAQIWSQVQVMASAKEGPQSDLALRMRKAGHDLVNSVQPKGSPLLRKDFLLKLPKLMKDLNEGLALIQWPDEAKKEFFSQLLPAHAECLKAAPQHELTQRLQENALNKVEQIAIPSREEAANDPLPSSLGDLSSPPILTVVTALSPDEVQQAGFVHESVVAAEGELDINLDAPGEPDPSLSELDINLDIPPPPAAGIQLVHHIQKGTAYQMLMQGQWKKVRLTWVSEGRSFFIFTQGHHMHKQTISLTGRTVAKMCETGRFKAFEQSELIERATVRARKQLAALVVPKKSAA
ncbi:MAG: DUF1631 family protein [Burkholderiales bacterium]|nr:DUF1631 family protein [Burkholderiales bacterium]MDE2431261.1 DUF1631 family protein [Burkholderiales bacterium]